MDERIGWVAGMPFSKDKKELIGDCIVFITMCFFSVLTPLLIVNVQFFQEIA
jgi:hypothetical protein